MVIAVYFLPTFSVFPDVQIPVSKSKVSVWGRGGVRWCRVACVGEHSVCVIIQLKLQLNAEIVLGELTKATVQPIPPCLSPPPAYPITQSTRVTLTPR